MLAIVHRVAPRLWDNAGLFDADRKISDTNPWNGEAGRLCPWVNLPSTKALANMHRIPGTTAGSSRHWVAFAPSGKPANVPTTLMSALTKPARSMELPVRFCAPISIWIIEAIVPPFGTFTMMGDIGGASGGTSAYP